MFKGTVDYEELGGEGIDVSDSHISILVGLKMK